MNPQRDGSDGGFYDNKGFYNLPDGSFYDPDNYYFDVEGYDTTGGYYDHYNVYHNAPIRKVQPQA